MKFSPGLITNSWELKLTALGLAVLLWAAVRSEQTTRFTMRDVPVEVRMAEGDWVRVSPPEPSSVTVEFFGPVRELLRVAFAEATLVIPIEEVDDTLELFRPRAEWLEWDGRFENLRVDQIRPSAVRLHFQPVVARTVPVAVRLATPLPAGLRLASDASTEPARVRIEGPRNRVERIDSVVVRIEDVESAIRSGEVRLLIDTTGTGVAISPREVLVRLPVTRALPDPAEIETIAGPGLRSSRAWPGRGERSSAASSGAGP